MNRDNVLVFNHRWAKSTGVNRMMEYTEDLPDYKVWCTDYQAPEDYVGSKLNSGQYRYLLEKNYDLQLDDQLIIHLSNDTVHSYITPYLKEHIESILKHY